MIKKTPKLLFAIALMATLLAFNNKPTEMKGIETFSVSLSVKDIAASKAFYEKLGFTQVKGAGSVAQKWMLMENGAARMGLFQGMFPRNTITFNPTDARKYYKMATENGMETVMVNGMDKTDGPASFALTDPDGNPILFDQHE